MSVSEHGACFCHLSIPACHFRRPAGPPPCLLGDDLARIHSPLLPAPAPGCRRTRELLEALSDEPALGGGEAGAGAVGVRLAADRRSALMDALGAAYDAYKVSVRVVGDKVTNGRTDGRDD